MKLWYKWWDPYVGCIWKRRGKLEEEEEKEEEEEVVVEEVAAVEQQLKQPQMKGAFQHDERRVSC